MKKLLVFGVIVLFLGLAIAPSINANIGELSVDIQQENDTLRLEWKYPGFCTILYGLYSFFMILVMRGISSTEIPFLIEDYAIELGCYWASKDNRLMSSSDEDCGCDDANTTEWGFPMICSLLLPFWGICFFIYFSSRGMFGANLIETMAQIGLSLNCYWVN